MRWEGKKAHIGFMNEQVIGVGVWGFVLPKTSGKLYRTASELCQLRTSRLE